MKNSELEDQANLWWAQYFPNGTSFVKKMYYDARKDGFDEATERMLNFSEWLVVYRNEEELKQSGSGGGRMPCSTQAALKYWQENIEGK